MAVRLSINESMLTRAITRGGFDISDFIEAYPKVQSWLEGIKQPTVKQSEDFFKKVYLPFGYLFLPEPPTEKLPVPYFRSQKTEQENVSMKGDTFNKFFAKIA